MRLKKAMTWGWHRDTGDRLRRHQDHVTHLVAEVSNTYGVTAKATKLARKAEHAVRELRCELDNLLYAEHPERGDDGLCNVYYGNAGRDEQEEA